MRNIIFVENPTQENVFEEDLKAIVKAGGVRATGE